MEIGKIIKCMVEEHWCGQMVKSMKGISIMIREKVKELLLGLMAVNMLANGKMESNMGKVLIRQQIKLQGKVNGLTERKLDG
jgi:hypothetical protein